MRGALMEVGERLAIGGDSDAAVYAGAPDDERPTERWHVDPIEVLTPALLHHRVDALGIGTPDIRAHRQRPPGGGLDGPPFRPSARPPDQHEPQAIRLEPRSLHREVREPLPVGRVAWRVVGALRGRELPQTPVPPPPPPPPPDEVEIDAGIFCNAPVARPRPPRFLSLPRGPPDPAAPPAER